MVSTECQIDDFVVQDAISGVFRVINPPFSTVFDSLVRIKVKAIDSRDEHIYEFYAFNCRLATEDEIAAAIAKRLCPPPENDFDKIVANLGLIRSFEETDQMFSARLLLAAQCVVDKSRKAAHAV